MKWENNKYVANELNLNSTNSEVRFIINQNPNSDTVYDASIFYHPGYTQYLSSFDSIEKAKAFIEKLVKDIKTIE